MTKGRIELATGPMFSGKTEWLISKLKNFDKEKTLAIRFTLDNRYSNDSLHSHNGKEYSAHSASTISEFEILIENSNHTILGIDEIQFFEIGLSGLLTRQKTKGITVYAAGLNLDYLATPWETSIAIENIADKLTHLKARCSICKKNNATLTQKIAGNRQRVTIGGVKLYEARCKEHFVVYHS